MPYRSVGSFFVYEVGPNQNNDCLCSIHIKDMPMSLFHDNLLTIFDVETLCRWAD